MPKNTNSKMLREIKGFDPSKYLIDTEDQINNTKYLPAWARLNWYLQYMAESKKIFGLTTESRLDREYIVYHAILTEYLPIKDGDKVASYCPIVIATGDASAKINTDNNIPPFESAETKAKARALASAGFILNVEKQLFDEGEIPVDGSLLKKELPDSSAPQTNAKPISKEDDAKEKKILKIALESFFPYGELKGERVADICSSTSFIEAIKAMSKTDYLDKMINDDISVNDFVHILLKYVIFGDTEKQQIVKEFIEEINKESSDA